jgi:hypothetical protein
VLRAPVKSQTEAGRAWGAISARYPLKPPPLAIAALTHRSRVRI